MTRLPVEVLHLVLSLYAAAYIDEMVGPQASCTENEETGDENATAVVSRPVVPLLLASYQFRQVTLEILSKYLSISLDASGDRLQSSPWQRLAAVREYILSGTTSGTIVAELELIARSSPMLAVYIFAKTSLRELQGVPKTYNVTALTVGDSQFAHAQGLWDVAKKFANDACEKALLAPTAARAMLVQYAQTTLSEAILAQRYGTLIPMLVRGVQALLTFQTLDAKRAEDDPARLPGYLPRFLQMLRLTDDGTHLERKHGVSEDVVMPGIQEISNLCTLLQRVDDIEVPDSEVYGECRALARRMNEEYQDQLNQMRAKAASGGTS